jgi:hypothetical protein
MMSKNEEDKEMRDIHVSENFRMAVREYLASLRADFFGYNIEEKPKPLKRREEIVRLFGEKSDAVRVNHLYFILKEMSEKTCDERLTNWCRDLALELVEELEGRLA